MPYSKHFTVTEEKKFKYQNKNKNLKNFNGKELAIFNSRRNNCHNQQKCYSKF